MPATSSLVASVALASTVTAQLLAPANDIYLPASESAEQPLQWLGGNSPYFAGPNVFDISPETPENCYVEQVAVNSRHGSRYPDPSAYEGWEDMQERFSASDYTPTGVLSFMKEWQAGLSNYDLQISMESPTGAKEAHDLGYQLRTRYPQLYNEGDDFIVWANNYTRVLQTAKFFVQGYLGFTAAEFGSVVSVTSTGYTGSIGDSLSPSDQCPNFYDSSGGDYATEWADVYLPPIQERLQALIKGNFTFETNDISQMPYICGFQSQMFGTLSPWCNVFTDYELQQYEYAQDIRYYYGLGPGTVLEQTMMMPYLNSLVGLLNQGPGINGTAANGSTFAVPNLLVTFINDGQLVELITASGVFDNETALSGTEMTKNRHFIASHFVSMRGTISWERLNCRVEDGSGSSTNSTITGRSASHSSPVLQSRYANSTTGSSTNETYIRIKLNDAVYPLPFCMDGPGKSCLLSEYVDYISSKYEAQGNWTENCNVTTPGAPTTVAGASFYTDLSSPWLQELPPY
ncbi:histidine acid phosphatase [Coniella lustricola]|uniref:Histidine acid phosphatase n=1 Tax=Coniella lustricola TaxID=2025994 RepID=A0A2T3A5T7_9PEZI|nr:histidine acid phosphatase [Coniella lustricola]